MKKLLSIPNLLILVIATLLYSCGDSQESKKKRMTVTTNSDEARDLFYQAIDVHQGLNWQRAENLLKSALAKDPNFVTAKAFKFPFVGNTDLKFLLIFNNNQLDKVSEMEAIYLKAWFQRVSGEWKESNETFDELTASISRYFNFLAT